MLTAGIAFIIALALSAIITPMVRDFAIARGWAGQPSSSRDVHKGAIPRVGGIAIVIAFFAPLVGLFFVESGPGSLFRRDMPVVIALFAGGVAIAALGIYDDLKGANAWQKFAVQIGVGVCAYQLGVRIDILNWFTDEPLRLGAWSGPITVLWIVGVINAMNLIDGLDGLASGVAFVAIVPTLVVSAYSGNVLMLLFMASLGGAILGFLIYNFRPASIFMGDTGSMFLGFVLATGSVVANAKSSATVSMIAPVLALGLPIMDTLLAVFRRSMAGTPLFTADKDHLHHRLLNKGLSHRQTVLVLYVLSAVFAGAALISAFANGAQLAVVLLVVAVIVGVFLRKLGYLSGQPGTSGRRKRNQLARSLVRNARSELRAAEDHSSIWYLIQPLREQLGPERFELCVYDETYSWKRAHDQSVHKPVELVINLHDGADSIGVLRAVWTDGREEVLRDDEISLELLADSITDAARRIQAYDDAEQAKIIPITRGTGSHDRVV